MENKKHKLWRIIITGVLSVLLLVPSCLWGTRPLYAEGEAPTKQTLGNMIITLLASFGVKTYIGVANSAQWIADNYDQFVSTVGGLKSAYQIYEEVNSTYDATTGKSTLSSDAYNSIAQYVRNFMSTYDVVDDSEPVEVGVYSYSKVGTYIEMLPNVAYILGYNGTNPSRLMVDSSGVRLYYTDTSDGYLNAFLVGPSTYKYKYENYDNWSSSFSYAYLGSKVYYVRDFYYGVKLRDQVSPLDTVEGWDSLTGAQKRQKALDKTFGSDASAGVEVSDNIYYQGDQSLNDMVSTTDQNAVFDWSRVAGIDKTLSEILEAVNEIALTDAWDTVNFPVPDAKEPVPSVPVPDNTPIPPWWDNIPELEAPTCPTLSACIVSGARAVSDNITSLMNLHSELAIYTGVGLSLGLALLIIGAFRR